ncbi:MAG: tRNA lysidine(34) synthetase TilS [Pseudomonadota bacterium]
MIFQELKRFVRKSALIGRGDQVLAAVSGGSDSLAMLHLLSRLGREWSLELHAACVDHGLRPEAKAEALFVKETARQWNVPFHSLKGHAAAEAERGKKSIQHAARDMRYRLLERLARKIGATRIALGHTLDDQAETVLMNIIRGCGIDGLGGISPMRGGLIIRPVLPFRRTRLREYLEERSITYIRDASNRDFRFLRPRIRRTIMPALAKENPGVARLLAGLADEARMTGDLLDSASRDFLAKHAGSLAGAVVVSRKQLLRRHPAQRAQIVRSLLEELSSSLLGFYRCHVEDILAMAAKGSGSQQLALPGGIVVRRQYDELIFSREKGGADRRLQGQSVAVTGPGTYVHRSAGARISVKGGSGEKSFPLELRTRRRGDRLLGRKKSLKKLLVDLKVPRFARDFIPLLARGKDVCWAGGLFRARDFTPAVAMEPEEELSPYFQWLVER